MTDSQSPTNKWTNDWPKSNILIVDDEPRVLSQLEQDLAFENFELFKATNTNEAAQILEKEDIHIILCDQKMPNCMSGTEFLYQARQKRPYLVSLMLSAFSEVEYLLDAINKARALSYILKPWDKQELIDRLREAQEISYLNRINESEQKVFDTTLYEKHQQCQTDLTHTKQLLNKAVIELNQTQDALHEANKNLAQFEERPIEAFSSLKQHTPPN